MAEQQTKKNPRFSKANLIEDLLAMERMCIGSFDPNDGWSQVANASGEMNRNYAHWRAIEMIRKMVESGDIGVK